MNLCTNKEITIPRLLLFSIAALFISGCFSTTPQRSVSSNWQSRKIAACIAVTRQDELIVVDVPAASNAISNKMAIATLSMGGSNSVDALVKILSQPTRSAVAVIGENDEMAAATLTEAIKRLPPGAKRSTQPICFAGDKSLGEPLKSSAEQAGLRLFVAPTP